MHSKVFRCAASLDLSTTTVARAPWTPAPPAHCVIRGNMLLSTGIFASNHFPSSRGFRFQTQRLYIELLINNSKEGTASEPFSRGGGGRVVQARSFARRRPSEQGN